jgi:hypothetical protein
MVFLVVPDTFRHESAAAPEAVVGNVIKLFLDVGGMPARHSLWVLRYRSGTGKITVP